MLQEDRRPGMLRLRLALVVVLLAGWNDCAPAFAQSDYPVRPITLIVPFAAGGPTDIVGRIIEESMSRTLGQQIVIENVVGAGGTTAATRAMRAAPDGYTIMLGHMGTHAAAVALYPRLAYNPSTDFAPIGMVAGMPVLIVSRNGIPARDLGEFVAYAKLHAAELTMAHAGLGSVSQVTCRLLNSIIGVSPKLAAFQGSGPAMNALVAGRIDYMCDQVVAVVPQAKAGLIRVYAVGTPARNPALPDVPTAREAGLPQFEASAWNALFAPKSIPRPIIAKLNAALVAALDDTKVRKRLLDLGSDIPDQAGRSPEALAALVKSEIAKWTPILRPVEGIN
jgi:tripartite-type tricarboxylate transporter receptor subunit TctC